MTINKPEVVAWRWRKPVVNDQGETVGETAWELSDTREFLPWWTNDPLIRLGDYERLQAECEKLRKKAATQADALIDINSLTRYTVGRRGNGPMHTFAHPNGPFLRYAEVEAAMATQARNKKGIEQ